MRLATTPHTQAPAAPAWTLAITGTAFFMVALDALVVVTALPSIHRDIGGSESTLAWTVNAYLLTYAAGIIPASGCGDRFGRKSTFIAGFMLFAVASAACALASTEWQLIAARAVQGLGAAAMAPLSLTILTASFPAERRGTVIGIWAGIGGIAAVIAPLLGGAVTQGLNWHWIFWINVPIGLSALLAARAKLTESSGPLASVDVPASLLIGLGSAGLVYGLVTGNGSGWSSPNVVVGLGAGLVLIAVFLLWEARSTAAMVPLRLFRSVAFSGAVATAFLMNAAQFGAAVQVVQYLQFGLRLTPLQSGLGFLPWTVPILLVTPWAGRLADRVGPRPLMMLGMLAFSLGLLSMAAVTSRAAYMGLALPLVVIGIGFAFTLPSSSAAAMGAVDRAEVGKASGVVNTIQRLGAAFGVAVTSAVFAAHGGFESLTAVTAGFQPAILCASAFAFVGALSAALVAKRVSRSQPQPEEASGSEPVGTHAIYSIGARPGLGNSE